MVLQSGASWARSRSIRALSQEEQPDAAGGENEQADRRQIHHELSLRAEQAPAVQIKKHAFPIERGFEVVVGDLCRKILWERVALGPRHREISGEPPLGQIGICQEKADSGLEHRSVVAGATGSPSAFIGIKRSSSIYLASQLPENSLRRSRTNSINHCARWCSTRKWLNA